jgi:arsenite methyltransferase
MAEVSAEPCCPPARQARCCEPSEKAECCGHGAEEGCGCAAEPPVSQADQDAAKMDVPDRTAAVAYALRGGPIE